jgi:hypothetical protein
LATFLHALDALVDLADHDGPMGPWATDQLVLRAPTRARSGRPGRFAALIGPAGVTAHLKGTPVPDALAAAAAFGIRADDDALAAALIRATTASEPSVVAHAGWMLARAGRLSGDPLRRVAAVDGVGARHVAAAAVLAAVAPEARPAVAAAVARQLDDVERALTYGLFGAPELLPESDDPADVVAAVLADHDVAGRVRRPPGSARSAGRRLIADRLAGRAGPLVELLRAVEAPGPVDVATAVWAGLDPSDDPRDDVVRRCFHGDTDRVAAAAAAIPPDALADVIRGAPAAGFALARHHLDAPGVADALLDVAFGADEAFLAEPGRIEVAVAAAARTPDRLIEPLGVASARARALTFAAHVPTEEVVAALLAMDPPARPLLRELWLRALAHQGEPATAERLRAAAAIWPDEAGPHLALSAALLPE